jgi:thiol-disulfide isomerase/thioredoxin
MRWIIKIALTLSLFVNGYFVFDEIQFYRRQEFGKAMDRAMSGELSKTTWKEGLEIFTSKLKKESNSLLHKKYYYINVWTDWCKPCIREMPWLDSLAGTMDKDVGYFFVSEMSDDAANQCIKKKNYKIKNFVFLNDMSDFVSAVCNEKRTKSKVYPMVLVLSNTGQLLHSSNGGYGNVREAAGFAEMIEGLE